MRRAAAAWERFWFTPQPTSSLALFRIAIGAVSFAWTLSLLPDLYAFFSANGVEPRPPVREPVGIWGVLNTFPNYSVAIALYVALLVASLCLLVGYRTRLANVIVFVGMVSFEHRAPSIWNSGDALIRILIFFLMLAPAGTSLSVDRWRRARDHFWEFPARAPWALRLVQVQISALYLSSVWLKLHGPDWLHGTAVSYAARMADYDRFPLPHVLSHSAVFSTAMTYWTIAIEISIGFLVWNRRVRPLVLTLGVVLHLVLGLTMRLGFFSETIITAYVAFLAPATATAAILAVRDRLHGFTARGGYPALVSVPRSGREHESGEAA